MFGFCPLASGSKGNCLYIGAKNTRLLIDVGISARSTVEKLQEIGVDPKSIEAILVTHDHSDHIQGIAQFCAQFHVPVFANAETAKGIVKAGLTRPKFKIFTTAEPFYFKEFFIHPFSVPHDTLDPVGFTFQIGNIKLSVCADLGYATSMVSKAIEKSDYLYLEANHEPSMVHASNRPRYLKERILGKQGHLSNQQCATLLSQVLHPKLKHVYLAHLSGECNAPQAALRTVEPVLQNHPATLSIAYQEKVSKCLFFEESESNFLLR